MRKVIEVFVITFLVVALISAALYFAFDIDLQGWWQVLIAAIILGVPTYTYFKNK